MTKTSQSKNLADKEAKIHEADVGKSVDLFWLVADIYNTEKHLEFSLMKIKESGMGEKERVLADAVCNLLNEVRIERSKLLKKLLGNIKLPFSLWCCFKHLSGATMQVMEVATREIFKKDYNEALDYTESAYKLWQTFWILLGICKMYNESDVKEFKKEIENVFGEFKCAECNCERRCNDG